MAFLRFQDWQRQKKMFHQALTSTNSFIAGVSGTQSFLLKELTDKGISVCGEAFKVFDAKEWTLLTLQQSVIQTDLFTKRRYFWVRNAQHLQQLGPWLKKLPKYNFPHTLFLQVDRKTSVVLKQVERLGGKTFWCGEPSVYDSKYFIHSMARDVGVHLDEGAQRLLQEVTSNDFIWILNELKKLALIFPNLPRKLTSDDIACHLGLVGQSQAFQLTQLLLTGASGAALDFLYHLIQRGESPLAVLGILSHHCRTVFRIQNRLPVKLPPRVAQQFQPYAERLGSRLGSVWSLCQDADIAFKSSRQKPEIRLSEIVLALQV